MPQQNSWGIGSNQYKKRPGAPDKVREEDVWLPSRGNADRQEAMGFSWDSSTLDLGKMQQSTTERVLARFYHVLPFHVWDAAALEGNPFTLPEVQTLLDGVTVGGRKIEQEQQVLALAEATGALAKLVAGDDFALNKRRSDGLHGIVARHEALDAGMFRGEGITRGGGTVNLGEYGTFNATGCEDGGVELLREFESATEYSSHVIAHPVEQALAHFCAGTRHQFYFDGNKRTSRLMMNGILMSSGYDAISIPFARRLEYNEHLRTLFVQADATDLMAFILDCRPRA